MLNIRDRKVNKMLSLGSLCSLREKTFVEDAVRIQTKKFLKVDYLVKNGRVAGKAAER